MRASCVSTFRLEALLSISLHNLNSELQIGSLHTKDLNWNSLHNFESNRSLILESAMAVETQTSALVEKIRKKLLDNAKWKSDENNEAQVTQTEEEADQEEDAVRVPTLEEIVANAMPGAFRCPQCKAAYVRGPNSRFCVACGVSRGGDASSFNIFFGSTYAFRLLCSTFDSEDAAATTLKREGGSSFKNNKGQDGLSTSDISSLELKWSDNEFRPSRQESSIAQATSSKAILPTGIDLDAFFDKQKPREVLNFGKESLVPTNSRSGMQHDMAVENVAQVKDDESMYPFPENVHQKGSEQDHAANDSSAPWKADFEMFETGVRDGSFQNRNAADGSGLLNHKVDTQSDSAENSNLFSAFPSDNLLNTPEAKPALPKIDSSISTVDIEDFFGNRGKTSTGAPIVDDMAEGDSLFGVKGTNSGNTSIPNANSVQETDWPDSFTWASDQDQLSSSWTQKNSSYQSHDSVKAAQNGTNDLLNLFETDNSFPTSTNDNRSSSKNDIPYEVDLFNRLEENKLLGSEVAVTAPQDHGSAVNINTAQSSFSTDSNRVVESLLSGVHDLSFMLADHLVIPSSQ